MYLKWSPLIERFNSRKTPDKLLLFLTASISWSSVQVRLYPHEPCSRLHSLQFTVIRDLWSANSLRGFSCWHRLQNLGSAQFSFFILVNIAYTEINEWLITKIEFDRDICLGGTLEHDKQDCCNHQQALQCFRKIAALAWKDQSI